MQLGMTMRINGASPTLSMNEVLEAERLAEAWGPTRIARPPATAAAARYPPPSGEEASGVVEASGDDESLPSSPGAAALSPLAPPSSGQFCGSEASAAQDENAHAAVFVGSAAQRAAAPPLHPAWQYALSLAVTLAGQQ